MNKKLSNLNKNLMSKDTEILELRQKLEEGMPPREEESYKAKKDNSKV